MTTRPNPMDGPTSGGPDAPADPRQSADAEFNDEITRIMTDAAGLRAERETVRRGEDERLARRQTAAIEALIRSHGQGEAAPGDHLAESRPQGTRASA